MSLRENYPRLVGLGLALAGLWHAVSLPEISPDLAIFWASGKAQMLGLNPYVANNLPGVPPSAGINFNAPPILLLFAPLSHLDFYVLRAIWLVLTLAVYAVVAREVRRWQPVSAWRDGALLGCAGLWSTVWFGQIYVVMLLAVVGVYLFLRRNPDDWRAALLIGLVAAVKPNFLLWPFVLFCAGYRRLALLAGGAFLFFSSLPALAFDPRVDGQWVRAVLWTAGGPDSPQDIAITSLLPRLHVYGQTIPILLAIAAIVGWFSYCFRPSLSNSCDLGITATLLAGPLTWLGYTVLLLPIVWRRKWTSPIALAVAVLCIPQWLLPYWSGPGITVLSLAEGFAVLLVGATIVHSALSNTGSREGRTQHVDRAARILKREQLHVVTRAQVELVADHIGEVNSS